VLLNVSILKSTPATTKTVEEGIVEAWNFHANLAGQCIQQWEMDLVFAVSDFGIMKGTYLIEKPDPLPSIEDNSWVEEREHFGVIVPKSPALRYLAWVTYVAAPEDADQLLLSEQVGKLLGITEGAVETEMSKFRSDESGETDPPSEPAPPDGDGD